MTAAAIASNGSPLLGRLITLAVESFATAPPVALTVEGNMTIAADIAMGWPCRQVGSPEDLAESAHQMLSEAPVVLIPPWVRLKPDVSRRPGLPMVEVHEAVLANCRPAGSDSLLMALVPASMLTSERARRVREFVMQHWQPIVVVYAQGALPSVHPSFEVAAVLLQGRQRTPSPLRFFRLPPKSKGVKVEDDFRRLLAMAGGQSQFGYVVREAIPPGESLSFDRRNPAVLAQQASLSEFGTTVRLGDVFQVLSPAFHEATHRELFCASDADGAVRVLSGKDIGRDGIIAPANEQSRWARIPKDQWLRPGDITLRRLHVLTDLGGLVTAEITDRDVPAAAGQTVLVVRPAPSLDEHQRHFTTLFLRTSLARTLAANSGASTIQISPGALSELSLPQPDEALSVALADLADAAQRLDAWRADAEALRQSAFLDASPKAARARILRSGRLLRMRVEAASLLDDFGHTVRTRFPHPIAYRWRRVEAEVSGGATPKAYEEVLAATEILLCYAAHLALVMARHAGIEPGALKEIRRKLAAGRSGPSFGDWIAVLQDVSGKSFRQLPDNQPLGELRSMLADGDVEAARKRLSDRRNDQSHLRGVDPVDLSAALREAHDDLATLLEHADFLCDLRLVHLTSVRWDSFRKSATVRYRELMGDHPVVPTRVMEHPSCDLEEGSLYVIDMEGQLHLLRPFLVGRECPTCKNWSTFHIDHAPRNGDVVLKSLEHGHVVTDPALRGPFRQVGLL